MPDKPANITEPGKFYAARGDGIQEVAPRDTADLWICRRVADYDAVNAVWDAWLPEGAAPVRCCVEARLANPGWRVEMAVTAAVRG